ATNVRWQPSFEVFGVVLGHQTGRRTRNCSTTDAFYPCPKAHSHRTWLLIDAAMQPRQGFGPSHATNVRWQPSFEVFGVVLGHQTGRRTRNCSTTDAFYPCPKAHSHRTWLLIDAAMQPLHGALPIYATNVRWQPSFEVFGVVLGHQTGRRTRNCSTTDAF